LKEEHNKWYSGYLDREFEMLVLRAFRFSGCPVFPTSGGRYFEAKDKGLIESAKHLINFR
jgi:esterase/lipase superfamily enzyme